MQAGKNRINSIKGNEVLIEMEHSLAKNAP